jgi:pimeloyl-ACP methyl ester carboxylesterase
LMKNLRLHDDGRWRWHWDPRFVKKARLDQDYLADRMLGQCRNIHVPVLVIRGMHSDIVSQRGVDELCRYVPHAETFNVSAAGHMIAGDRNDVFNGAVIEFLGRHMPATPPPRA